jgi:predicted methyltransferase
MDVKKTLLLLLCVVVGLPALAQDDRTETKIRAALASDIRTDEEKERDGNRKPVETLAFFGLRDDMRVLELIPGGGWYTKILAPTLRDEGKLYVSIFTDGLAEGLLKEPGFDKVEVLDIGVTPERTGPFGTRDVAPFSFGVTGLDMVLTFRNMHNFTAAGRAAINSAVFDALKPGGLYGVVDHTRRHMQPMYDENRRRADPVEIIKEVLDAGFRFEGYSDLHYRPDDELRYEVGRATVTGNTDRFTLLFSKP